MLQDLVAELAGLLGGVDLGLARGRQQVEVLHEAAERDSDDGQREDDPRAAAPPDPEGNEPEVVPAGLHLLLLLQKPLGPELLGPLPALGVVGEEPGVDEDLALRGDVVARELRVGEVHVGDEERDRHAEAECLLDDRLEVREPLQVRLRHRGVGAEDGVELAPQLALDLRVVH